MANNTYPKNAANLWFIRKNNSDKPISGLLLYEKALDLNTNYIESS